MIINFIVISQLIIYILIYIVFSKAYNPQSSIERLLIHVAPIAMLGIAMISSYVEFKDNIRLILFDNRKVMKLVDNFVSWIDRN